MGDFANDEYEFETATRFETVDSSYLSSSSNVCRMSMDHGGIRGGVCGVVGGHRGGEVLEACRSFNFVSRVVHSLTASLCSVGS